MSGTDRFAPEGYLWVCVACGKTAKDRYGIEGTKSAGWDASCMLNSVLAKETDLEYKPTPTPLLDGTGTNAFECSVVRIGTLQNRDWRK